MSAEARRARKQDALTTALHNALLTLRSALDQGAEPLSELTKLAVRRREQLRTEQESGRLDLERRELLQREIQVLEAYYSRLQDGGVISPADAMEHIRAWFGTETSKRAELGGQAKTALDHAFRFLEESLGQGQELVIFVTELTAGYDTSWLIENFGCDAYFRHNRELLFDDTQHRIREEIIAAKAETNL